MAPPGPCAPLSPWGLRSPDVNPSGLGAPSPWPLTRLVEVPGLQTNYSRRRRLGHPVRKHDFLPPRLPSVPLAPLTVGPALPDEVSVELVVHVDLHVVHPVNLQENRTSPETSSRGHGVYRGQTHHQSPSLRADSSCLCHLRSLFQDCPLAPLKDLSVTFLDFASFYFRA